MAHVPHSLTEDFPQKVDRISQLKNSDKHFAKLYVRYHDLNRAIHAAETDVAPTDDFHMAELRRERAQLKDEIYRIMTTA